VGFPEYSSQIYQFKSSSFDLYKYFFSTLATDSIFLEERKLLSLTLDPNWKLIDLCPDPFLIYDKCSDRKFFSQGAVSFKKQHKDESNQGVTIAISPYEDIVISPWSNKAKQHFNEIFLNARLLRIEKWDFMRGFRDNIKELYYQDRTR
jgi:hypothetical protein